jgi:hypothetical protein
MKYENILEDSKMVWNEFTNGSKPGVENFVPFQASQNNHLGGQNYAKTHAIGNFNKAKAYDLRSPIK